MKTDKWMFALALAGAVALTGCGSDQKPDASSDTKTPEEVQAAAQNAFATADDALKASFAKADAAFKGGDLNGALMELRQLVGNPQLTPAQMKAVQDLMAKARKMITDAAPK